MYGLDESWVASSTPVQHAGEIELAMTGGDPSAHALVGGSTWGPDHSGFQPDTGLTWLAALPDAAVPAAIGHPAPSTVGMLDDWRNLFNPHSPSFWLLLAALAAVGFIHLELNTKVGPAHAHIGA